MAQPNVEKESAFRMESLPGRCDGNLKRRSVGRVWFSADSSKNFRLANSISFLLRLVGSPYLNLDCVNVV
jgi:hypothetical protein